LVLTLLEDRLVDGRSEAVDIVGNQVWQVGIVGRRTLRLWAIPDHDHLPAVVSVQLSKQTNRVLRLNVLQHACSPNMIH